MACLIRDPGSGQIVPNDLSPCLTPCPDGQGVKTGQVFRWASAETSCQFFGLDRGIGHLASLPLIEATAWGQW